MRLHPPLSKERRKRYLAGKRAPPEKIIPLTTLKEISPVASLNNDSPSMIRFNL
jgi:hypothetical protein